GEEYIWLNYAHLMLNLPIAKIKGRWTVSRRISKLRQLGLIETIKTKDNTIYYTFTDRLIDICFARTKDRKRIKAYNEENITNDRPVAPVAKDPIAVIAKDPVAIDATAQYITKNTILNKDYNIKQIL
ncbi:MAG: hypothetical protein N2748_03185, partial [candidate division WOR-3 bacterium]|nr:hypothetical protein [candidate division WOR-3 bacterium]